MSQQHTTIGIDGMTCNGCVKSVTRALQQVAGVQNVTVSLADQRAEVDFDDNQTDVAALREAIEDAGFDVIA